eukprot:286372-Pelagomonas_calceolata.AAC.1
MAAFSADKGMWMAAFSAVKGMRVAAFSLGKDVPVAATSKLVSSQGDDGGWLPPCEWDLLCAQPFTD